MKNLLYLNYPCPWVIPFKESGEWNTIKADIIRYEPLRISKPDREINGIIAIAPKIDKQKFIDDMQHLASHLMPDPEKDVPFFWLVISERPGKSPVLYGSFTRKFRKDSIENLPQEFYQANHNWKGWRDEFRTYGMKQALPL